MRTLGTALIFLAGIVIGASGALAQPKVTAVRIGPHPDKTRFVMELTEEPAYRVFALPDPFRVVLDLPELDWQLPDDAWRKGGGMVKALRFGLFAPGTSRVVLDVEGPVRIKSVFTIGPTGGKPYRLVVDLVPVTRQAFLAEPGRAIHSAKALPALQPSKPRIEGKTDDRITVVVDPGHGGVDPGAIGVSGVREKDVVLRVAQELKRQLEAKGRYRVILTRTKDIFLTLAQRREVARQAGADLFISLHADSHKSRKVRGASVYTLSETASDAVASELAERENKADLIAGVDLEGQTDDVSSILLDLTQRETMNLSAQFAAMTVEELSKRTKVLANTHRFAGFVVLKSHDVPSVLIELGFLSNRADDRLLTAPKQRKRLAEAVRAAVNRYFSWQASLRRS
ncbi:MAG: N-acetylmuramoyl-L-alanine amidase [Kiloniellales bacterium]|nr:N-acetylmuramoyl-L-alanine amidase [Kiloniellales bacterium]